MNHTSVELLASGADPVVLIRNLFSSTQVQEIMAEIEKICRLNLLLPGSITGSATDSNNNTKSNFGNFLNDIFEPGRSSIVNYTRGNLLQLNLVSILEQQHYIFKYILHCNHVATLLSYYTNNNDYHPHRDDCVLTSLSYFWKQPQGFKGGDLVFPETGLTVTPEFGDTIIFPSIATHAVTPVTVTSNESYSGRFVVSNFLKRG